MYLSGKNPLYALFSFIARGSFRYYWLFLSVSVLVTLILLFFASKLHLELGFVNLMPKEDERFQKYQQITGEFGGTDLLLVVLVSPSLRHSKIFADTLFRRFNKHKKYVRFVDYKVNIDFFENYALYFLKEEDLKKLKRNLNSSGWLRKVLQKGEITKFYNEINKHLFELSADQDLKEDEEDLKKGFRGLRKLLETQKAYFEGNGSSKNLRKSLEELGWSKKKPEQEIFEDGYYVSKDKEMLLIILKPTNPMHDMQFFREMTEAIEREIQSVKDKFPDVRVELTGMVKMMADDWAAVQRDLRFTGVLALILILLLFIMSFRTFKAPVLAIIPIIMGIVWTFGFTQIVIGRLNVITSVIAPILLGLGIDFSIHILSRFREEKGRGKNFESAISLSLIQTGRGVFIGAITTAFAFFSLVFGKFRGIQEMGLVIGIGILACFLAVLFVMPPLLYLFDKKPFYGGKKFRRVEMELMETLGKKSVNHPKSFLFPGIISSLLLLSGFFFLHYEYNSLALLPKLKSVDIQNEVAKKFEMSFDFGMVIVSDPKTMRETVDILNGTREVGMVDALSEYIPENQKVKIPVVHEIHKSIKDLSVSSVDKENPVQFQKELNELKMNLIEIQDLAFISGLDTLERETDETLEEVERNLALIDRNTDYSALQKDFSEELKVIVHKLKKMAQAETLKISQLPFSIQDKFISSKDKFALYVYPKRDIWDERNMASFNNLLLSISEEATGPSLIWGRILEYLKRDVVVTTLLAALAIFISLLINFRSLILSLFAMIPVFSALILTLGTMGLTGLTLNYASIIGIPLILGIGIDDGVHIIHRFQVEGFKNLPLVLRSTGRAILLTTLTTVAGFGALILAYDKSIWYIGLIVAMGVGYAYLATIFVLVPILAIKNFKEVK